MKKGLYFLFLPLLAVSAGAQSASSSAQASSSTSAAASADAGRTAAAASESSQVNAELSKKIDTKDAKVGDEVVAHTTSSARLADGTKLPKGTKLVGKVTEVQPKEGKHSASHLAFAFDHALLHDGRSLPVHAMMTSLSAPAAVSASADGSDDMMSSSGGGSASAGGGVRGGGLVGGAVRGGGGLVSNTASTVGSTTGAALNTTGNVAAGGVRTTGAVAGTAATSTAVDLRSVPVANLPGVTFSSSASASSTTALDATGRNISLAGGSQMSLSLSALAQ